MKKIIGIAILAVLFSSAVSFAEDTGISGFDALNLKLPADGSGTISIAGSRGLKQWQPHFGLTGGFYRHLISAKRNNQDIWLVNYALAGDLTAAMGIFDFLSVGAEVPFAFENIKNSVTAASHDEMSIGDIRFDLKGRIIEDKDWHPGVAIIPSVFIPTGDVNKFTGNTGLRYQGLLVADKDFGPVYVSVNGGYRFVEKKTVITRVIDDQLLYGIGLMIPMPVWDKTIKFIVEGSGSSEVRDFSKDTTSIEAIGGLRKEFKNGLRIDLAGSAGIVKSLGTPDYRVLAGIGWTMPKRLPAAPVTPVTPEISEVINFASSSWRIDPRYYDSLHSIGLKLIDHRGAKVLAEGYADSTGPASYNQALSERRAEEVRKYLIYFGGNEDQITAVGHSSADPVAPNDTRDGRAKNRRATIKGQ